MTRRRRKRRRLESHPSPVENNFSNTRRLLFGSDPPGLTNNSLSDPLRPSHTTQLLGLPNSILSIPSMPQPLSTRPGPSQQVQMLLATPDTIAELAVRPSGDLISSVSRVEIKIEDESDDYDADFERRTRKARREDEERDVQMAIEAMKARTAKQRNDALLARELSDARWAGEAWAISKDRDAQRTRHKSDARRSILCQEPKEVPKAGYASHTQHPSRFTTDRGGRHLPRVRRWSVHTKPLLIPSLSSFNYENAEVSLALSERREKAQWKPPFIPRSFEGQPFALLSDVDHPNDRSDTTDFVADLSNADYNKPKDPFPDSFASERATGWSNGNSLENEAVEVSNRPSIARNKQALLDAKPSTLSSGGSARPHCFDFISSRGNEYFCEIDEDYLTDRFNLTGLNTDVQYYQYALDLVTDVFDLDCDDDMREAIEKSARHLYGLVHARYITTTRGLAKMVDKYKKGDFGKCPRVMCNSHLLLPTGMADLPNLQSVKLYCSKCEDLYNPKSSRHSIIDGAYFGTSFQNILFQVYPALIPEKSIKRYEPKVFGFKVHAAAALQRWQDGKREDMQGRLKPVGFENAFVEDTQDFEEEMQDEEATLGGEGMEVGEDLAD